MFWWQVHLDDERKARVGRSMSLIPIWEISGTRSASFDHIFSPADPTNWYEDSVDITAKGPILPPRPTLLGPPKVTMSLRAGDG